MDVIKITNYIRQNATNSYKERVKILGEDSPISDLSNPLLKYDTVMNEFAKSLINVIGHTVLNRISNFENPLSKFKKSTDGIGIDIREIATGLVQAFDYELTTEGIAKMFKLYPAEYAECFHRLNRQRIFPITISEKELKLALNSWSDLERLLTDKANLLYQSNYLEEFELMKDLLRSAVQKDNIKTIALDGEVTKETSDDFIELIKNVSSSFKFPDLTNSAYGNAHPDSRIYPVSQIDDIALILPYMLKNKIQVSSLAGAFNKDELTFNVDVVTEVDSLGYICKEVDDEKKYYAVDAIVCDKNFFRVYDDEDNGLNSNDLPTARAYNTYLHIWQTLSTSPFVCVNAIVHEVDEDTIPEGYFDNLIDKDTTISD